MKILHTPARFYPYVGGVEKYVCTLCRELAGKKHDVTVICANEPFQKAGMQVNSIRVKRLDYLCKIANTNITPALPVRLWKEDCDIIHTHIPTPWSADWSTTVGRIRKIPVVLTYHNDIAGMGMYRHIADAYNRALLKRTLKESRCIIVTSPGFSSPSLLPYREKIRIIPNSVDTKFFRPASGEKIGDIFFLGLMDEYHRYKGLEYLLAAVRQIKQVMPDIRLVIGGSGRMAGYYRTMAESLGISQNVKFAGFIPDRDLASYYNGCTVFVLPSTDPTREGFGIVALEAMACGRPVVTSEITGVAGDIRKRGAGVIVRPGDIGGLSEAIQQILLDERRAEEMGHAARTLVENKYSSYSVAEQVLGLYQEFL
jgi:glycosyltransferase involved in cell wall biosynthesis